MRDLLLDLALGIRHEQAKSNKPGAFRHNQAIYQAGSFGKKQSGQNVRYFKECLGERQSITQNGVRPIDTRNSQLTSAAKTSVRPPGLSTDEREHSFP